MCCICEPPERLSFHLHARTDQGELNLFRIIIIVLCQSKSCCIIDFVCNKNKKRTTLCICVCICVRICVSGTLGGTPGHAHRRHARRARPPKGPRRDPDPKGAQKGPRSGLEGGSCSCRPAATREEGVCGAATEPHAAGSQGMFPQGVH